MDKAPNDEKGAMYASKKCPECYTYIPMEAGVCPSCKARVGKMDSHGMASRPTNWRNIILCIIAWLVFAIFIKYAFF